MLWPTMTKSSISTGGGDQRLQRPGERAAVGRDMKARIVGERDRREAEIARQRRAVVVVLPRPVQVAHAEPVHEHASFPVASGMVLARASLSSVEGPPVAAKAHGQRQRIAGRGEMVADDAVERGERDLPLPR